MPVRLTTEIFIERARKMHGDKYDYSKVNYVNSYTKVCIICPKHGEFWQTPGHHLNGCGCWYCSYDFRALLRRKSVGEFIGVAEALHENKYDYSKVKYINENTKVEIVCPEHGSFWQTPKDHLQGHGCPKCSNSFKLDYDVFMQRAREVHGDKYDYSKVIFDNVFSKISIICPEHGVFEQELNSHLRGRGCPICGIKKSFAVKKANSTVSSSSISNDLYHLLCDYFGDSDVFSEYDEDDRYPFHCDFYIKSKDLFIELNGFWTHNDHWFDKNNQNDLIELADWESKSLSSEFYKSAIETWTVRDVIKREHARKNNLNYVVFWNGSKRNTFLTDEIESWFTMGCPIRQDWK